LGDFGDAGLIGELDLDLFTGELDLDLCFGANGLLGLLGVITRLALEVNNGVEGLIETEARRAACKSSSSSSDSDSVSGVKVEKLRLGMKGLEEGVLMAMILGELKKLSSSSSSSLKPRLGLPIGVAKFELYPEEDSGLTYITVCSNKCSLF
jgi:hypothetical protein